MGMSDGFAALAVLIVMGWLVFFKLKQKYPDLAGSVTDVFSSKPVPTLNQKQMMPMDEVQQTYPERRSMM